MFHSRKSTLFMKWPIVVINSVGVNRAAKTTNDGDEGADRIYRIYPRAARASFFLESSASDSAICLRYRF